MFWDIFLLASFIYVVTILFIAKIFFKDVIQATLGAFQKGTLRCLLLNSVHAGAGLTITAATHIILLHAMNIEEEKQILGRAYRLGRKEPLNVYKLVHQDEMDVAA